MCKKDADTCNMNSKPTSAFGVFWFEIWERRIESEEIRLYLVYMYEDVLKIA